MNDQDKILISSYLDGDLNSQEIEYIDSLI